MNASVITFHPGYSYLERRIPCLATGCLRLLVLDMGLPALDGFNIRPVGHGNAQVVPGGFHAQKAGLPGGKLNHFLRHGIVAMVPVRAVRRKNHGIVRWFGCCCDHGHRCCHLNFTAPPRRQRQFQPVTPDSRAPPSHRPDSAHSPPAAMLPRLRSGHRNWQNP